MDSYKSMCGGVATGEEKTCAAVCHMCKKTLQAESLSILC